MKNMGGSQGDLSEELVTQEKRKKGCRINQDLHPQGLTSQMPMGQMPVGGATGSGPEHQTDTQLRDSLNVWTAQCQGLRRRQHRTEHRQRTEIKIPDPAVNRTRAAGLEGRDSTDHATALFFLCFSKMQILYKEVAKVDLTWIWLVRFHEFLQ